MSHVEEFKRGLKYRPSNIFFYSIVTTFFRDNGVVPTSEQVLEVYGKARINGFSITKNVLQQVAHAIYLETSVFDHSCQPNATYSYIGKEMIVRCTREGVKNFSEVRICYEDEPNLLRSERKAYFLENYYFDCQCEKCSDENSQEEAFGRACVKCPNCGGGVALSEESKFETNLVKCNKCKKDVSPAYLLKYWISREGFRDLAHTYSFPFFKGVRSAVHYLHKAVESLFFPTEREHLKILRSYFTTSEVCDDIP